MAVWERTCFVSRCMSWTEPEEQGDGQECPSHRVEPGRNACPTTGKNACATDDTPSVRPAAPGQCHDGAREDVQVEPRRPVPHVKLVQQHALGVAGIGPA